MTSTVDNEINQSRAVLEEILQRWEYQVYYADANPSLLSRVTEFVLEQIRLLFGNIDIPEGTGDFISYTMLAAAIVLFILVIWRLVKWTRKPQSVYRPSDLIDDATEASLRPEDWHRLAQDEALSGDYRQAVRRSFMALLLFAAQAKWLRAEVWKTNWEYAAEWQKSRPEQADEFLAAAAVFERIWYGGGTANAENWQLIDQTVTRLFREVGSDAK